jgi:hypothetical protein
MEITPMSHRIALAAARVGVAVILAATAVGASYLGAPPARAGNPCFHQMRASVEDSFVVKLIHAGVSVRRVQVYGHPGYWISGGAHEIGHLRPDGEVLFDTVRLAGDVLAWNDGSITYRIEGAADLATALEIAASMR